MFFKVISDFGVSRLFQELGCTHFRCSRIASFCRRELKKNWNYFSGVYFSKKNFKIFDLNKPKNQFWKTDVKFF